MPEEQPQGHGQASQQRGFDPSIYRPVTMGGLVKMPGGGMPGGGMMGGGMPGGGSMPTAQKAGSIGVGSRVRDQEKGNTGEIIAVEKGTRVYDGRPHSYITSITMRTDAGEEYHVRRSALKLIMPEPSEEEAAIDPALARIVDMLNKPSTSCGSPISKRPSSPRNRSAPGSRLAHQALRPRRNKSTPARLARQPQPPDERRYDTDGGLYTMAEFVGYYGGTAEWEAARRQPQPQLAQLAQEGQLHRPPPLQSTSSRRGACILSAPSQPSPLQGTWPAAGAASHQHQAEPAIARVQPQPTPKPQPSPAPEPELEPDPEPEPEPETKLEPEP